ncbi:Beta-1,4 N-acetylgalactosaminyltransferase 2 [Saguinus oedipus]|uniref:Beta-1,4 N-acetylgalactosaminyltransferase 2 n=1 Tax=Saguinus oedipus TaxID=9490 RepID=A0ABQ9VRF0_SAGOE|nr:Beta-1,4 N-acetylgalactosaminyltransferase 2 [Saguinus oedipus]
MDKSSRFLQLLKISVIILGLSVVGFMLRGVSLQAVFSSLKPELASPAQGVQKLKLLPEEHLRNLFTYDGVWLFPKNQCICEANKEQGSYNFQDAYGQSDLPAVNARRQAEFEHFQRREGLPRPLPLLAQPNLPFGYPVHGVEVMPLHTVPIPGLQFEGPDAPIYELWLVSAFDGAPVQNQGAAGVPERTSQATLMNRTPWLLLLLLREEAATAAMGSSTAWPLSGLGLAGQRVTLTASLGTLNTLADVPDNVVQGRGQKQLTISTSDRKLLKFILQHVTYTSMGYQHHKVDIVSLESRSSVAKFPVTIRNPVIPRLYDPGPAHIEDKERKLRNLVTIATKTFLRPHKLMTMLRSIREYYPDLTVIVADDSGKPLEIKDNHVEYYTMPFGKGWFAGRNLAISQVTTKYVLWVDDDFLFNSKTKIEVLVDVLEKTELDVLQSVEMDKWGEERVKNYVREEEAEEEEGVGLMQEVGGSVLGNVFQFKLLLEQSENGACLHKRTGFFQPLDGFPSCVVTSGVVNFFLAHTERLQRVGFDPRLQRVAHSEFFIDGLGTLLVGSCPEVTIGHQSRSPVVDPELAALKKTYDTYRVNTLAQVQFKLALHYFKNHLQCAT